MTMGKEGIDVCKPQSTNSNRQYSVVTRYVGKAASYCYKQYKSLVKQLATIQAAGAEAQNSQDHDAATLKKWEEDANTFVDAVKSLKGKLNSMRSFAAKASGD